MSRSLLLFALVPIGLLSLTLVGADPPPAPYFNGFETNRAGWDVFGGQLDAVRVASGTNGVASRTGSFHAQAGQFDLDSGGGSAATNWDGYSMVFPLGGFTTRVWVYLDASLGGACSTAAQCGGPPGVCAPSGFCDVRFDWSSAIGDPLGNHRRDFVFNVGTNPTTGVGLVVSAGNNAGRSNSFPSNPAHSPIGITTTGWYLLEHEFYDGGAATLAVDLRLIDASMTTLMTWTLSDPSDVIGVTVGGNRYGWFASQELPFLALDDTERTGLVVTTTSTTTSTTALLSTTSSVALTTSTTSTTSTTLGPFEITRAVLRSQRDGDGRGRIRVRGDVATTPPADTMIGSMAITLRVRDDLGVDMSHTFPPSSCTCGRHDCSAAPRRIRCRDGDAKIVLRSRPPIHEVFRMRARFRNLEIDAPFDGPVIGTLTYGPLTMRQDSIAFCRVRPRSLVCRER